MGAASTYSFVALRFGDSLHSGLESPVPARMTCLGRKCEFVDSNIGVTFGNAKITQDLNDTSRHRTFGQDCAKINFVRYCISPVIINITVCVVYVDLSVLPSTFSKILALMCSEGVQGNCKCSL